MDFRPNRAGFREIAESAAVEQLVTTAATGVRNRARQNARTISSRLSDAIETSEVQHDGDGVFVDVGYDKTSPGFALWWHEVGTVDFPATPHLRPAMRRD